MHAHTLQSSALPSPAGSGRSRFDSRLEVSGEAGGFGADDWLETTSHMSAADAAERSRERGGGSSVAGSVRRMSDVEALRDADDSSLLSRSRKQRISIDIG
jgi:hypothetical protein